MSAPAEYPTPLGPRRPSVASNAAPNSIDRIEPASIIFACPACHLPLGFRGRSADAGALTCPGCALSVPVVAGFARFTEAAAGGTPELADSTSAYTRYIGRAAGRGSLDLYAAFEPFNEATRAIYPLIGMMRANLQPGDLVLDLRCRSGWTGALLAGLFPEQHVVSFWEGPSNILGYAGYAHWLSPADRPANWTVAFADPRKGVPLPTAAAALVFGADCLHRVAYQPFLAECLRVCRPDGVMIFPHVHLANGQPSPYFERGGTILHGTVYRDWFARALAGSGRRAFVLSEPNLFCAQPGRPLRDQAGTADYNGLVAVLRDEAVEPLGPPRRPWADGDHLVANPLVSVDGRSLTASFDSAALAGEAEYLLARHPAYARRLKERLPAVLEDDDLRVLYWAGLGLPLAAIRQKTGLPPQAFASAIDRLERCEVALPAPIGPAMARLQTFLATRQVATPFDRQHFATLWPGARALYGDRPVLVAEDGSAFAFEDAQTIVSALASVLRDNGVGPGAAMAMIGPFGAEAILAIWAAWLLGAAVAPVDATGPDARVAQTLALIDPALVLCHAASVSKVPARPRVLVFGPPDEAGGHATLSQAVEPHLGTAAIDAGACREDSDAAILFTSGSTGAPKGLVLSQGALFRGAAQLVKSAGWEAGDVLLGLGGLHTMSGLRNPCVAALAAGATIVVPATGTTQHPAAVAETCRTAGVTVISTVPAFLNLVTEALRRGRLHFGPLRQVAVTGSALPLRWQHDFETSAGIRVFAYYGLTETGGLCLANPVGSARGDAGDVGMAAGALVRIVDEAGRRIDPGAIGELQIHTANLARRLDGEPMPLTDGWLRTGDLARYDSGGHVVLCGRRDRQVKNHHGEVVQPEAIEAALLRRTDIADAAVVADDRSGILRLTGFVVPASTHGGDAWLEGLEASIRLDRLIALDSIPRNANGKIASERLRALCE